MSCTACKNRRLVEAAQVGSLDAFDHLVRLNQGSVMRFLETQTGNRELAADLTQITFVTAFEHIHQLADSTSFVPWLYQIARRAWQMELRRQRSKRFISLTQIASHYVPPSALVHVQPEVESIDQRDLVWLVLDSLSPANRDALCLRHIAGFSDSEIAEALDISPAAAQKRAYRAEIQFRERYDELSRYADVAVDGERLQLADMPITSRSRS